jgi:hypothetical protein
MNLHFSEPYLEFDGRLFDSIKLALKEIRSAKNNSHRVRSQKTCVSNKKNAYKKKRKDSNG